MHHTRASDPNRGIAKETGQPARSQRASLPSPLPISDILAEARIGNIPSASALPSGEVPRPQDLPDTPPVDWTRGWNAEEQREYEITHWLPRLRGDAFCLIEVLRSLARPAWSREHPWATCTVSLDELGRRIGRDRKTVRRLLRIPGMGQFISWRAVRRRDPATNQILRGVFQYRVAMFTPLIPEHAASLSQMWTSSGQNPGNKLPGSGSPIGTAPWQKLGNTPGPEVPSQFQGPANVQGCSVVKGNVVERLRTELKQLGVHPTVILRLIETYPISYLRQQLDNFASQARSKRNPAGFIRKAIEDGYSPISPPLRGHRGEESNDQRVRAEALLETLPDIEKEDLMQRAEKSLREELGEGIPIPQGAIRARVLRWLGAEGPVDVPGSPPRVFEAEDLATRFYSWYARRKLEDGIDITASSNAPEIVRARWIAWLVMSQLGLGGRQIARLSGTSPGAIRYALAHAGPDVRRLADAWHKRFQDAVDLLVGHR
jgi:SOS response regulatory protein OraA/RecX